MKLCIAEPIRHVVVDAVLTVQEPRKVIAQTAAEAPAEAVAPTAACEQEKKNYNLVIAEAFYPLPLMLLFA